MIEEDKVFQTSNKKGSVGYMLGTGKNLLLAEKKRNKNGDRFRKEARKVHNEKSIRLNNFDYSAIKEEIT